LFADRGLAWGVVGCQAFVVSSFPASLAEEPSMAAGLLALLGILAAVLATWELRRVVRFVRIQVAPALWAERWRRIARTLPTCDNSAQLEEGEIVRVVGVVTGDGRLDRAVLSHLHSWGEFGETVDDLSQGEDFSVRLSDGELVTVNAADAVRAGRVRLLDGRRDERSGGGVSSRHRQVVVGQVVAVYGRLERVIDTRATSPHPRVSPTAWRLSAAPDHPLVVEGTRQAARLRRSLRDEASGRILALPVFGVSMLLLLMSAPTAVGFGGVFSLLEHAGVSGLVFTAFLAVVGAPGTLRSWRRWFVVTGFLAAAVIGFWCGVLR
jgi:hypothetical protein